MSDAPVQNYANHVRRIPRLYAVSFLAVALWVLWNVWVLFRQPSIGAGMALLAGLGMCGIGWFARTNALVVQDRVIRLEERLRLARLLPDDLRGRIDEFTMAQLAALRFAGDAELPALARKVLTEGMTQRGEIKRAIQQWRADWHRV